MQHRTKRIRKIIKRANFALQINRKKDLQHGQPGSKIHFFPPHFFNNVHSLK